jgi:DNA-binding response OmpR family regulator
MIVDDNKDLAYGLEVRLRAHGYQVLLAENGNSAIAMALSEILSAIILDLNLPEEDGFVILGKLRGLPAVASVPIIIMTGDHSADTKRRVLGAGVAGLLEKPIDHHLLLSILRGIQQRSLDSNRSNAAAHCTSIKD